MDALVTIVPIRVTTGRIMGAIPAVSASQFTTDPTIAVPDTGLAACIMSGNLVTGHGGMVGKFGSAAITSREDTRPRGVASATIGTAAGQRTLRAGVALA
jgi:hypothetical protein